MNGIVARELQIADLEAQLGLHACRAATLERDNAELRAALKPFAQLTAFHDYCVLAGIGEECWRAKELLDRCEAAARPASVPGNFLIAGKLPGIGPGSQDENGHESTIGRATSREEATRIADDARGRGWTDVVIYG
jgi:hypothetical protein